MLGIVLPLLKGQALQMVKSAININQRLTWAEFRTELVETFMTDTRERKMRRELKELKQKNNNYDEFANKYR